MVLSKEHILEIVRLAVPIICANEGSYGSVNKNDNGAVSVGKMQWHANRALCLLKTVCNANTLQAKEVLGDKLHQEIIIAVSTAWLNRMVTADEAAALSRLLSTPNGKAAQDALAEADITGYINKGTVYGLTDYGALIYFADGVNQYGAASPLWKSIAEKALAGKGDVAAMFAATKTLTTSYIDRREKVYNAVLALNLKGETMPMSATVITSLALVEHAKKALTENWGYCLGGYGTVLTESFLIQKCGQSNGVGAYNTSHLDYLRQFMGKRVTDCYGLVKSFLWWNGGSVTYNAVQDRNQESAYNAAKEKGALSAMPEIPGLILSLCNSSGKHTHVGVYIGNGEFIECAGAPVGMRKGKIQNGQIAIGSRFSHWFKDTFISYSADASAVPSPTPKSGSGNGLSSSAYVAYTVKAGDSLWAIAAKYLGTGARYKEIMTLNGLTSDVIRPGQLLMIPGK